jgi:pimeloyl-ACP methyl ester carboxylesterase
MRLEKFAVDVPQRTLDDLQERLKRTRWTDEIDDGWALGTDGGELRKLVEHWTGAFDWRRQEAAINRLTQFRATVNGVGIHFVHERGAGDRPLPIILTHGYPDSFLRFAKIIPMLTHPQAHGGNPSDAFDVVVPSSSRLRIFGQANHGWRHLPRWRSLALADDRRARIRALRGARRRLGEHGYGAPRSEPRALTRRRAPHRRSYTLARGLNDSPAGLASWIVDKFHAWSDCGGDVERSFTKDELLTNVTLYWVTETIGSSFLPYADFVNAGAVTWIKEAFRQWIGSAAGRFFNVQRWTEMPRGGHFAAMEEPELLVDDIRQFFRPLRR